MAYLRKADDVPRVAVRAVLLARFRRNAARRTEFEGAVYADGRAAQLVDDLQGGRTVVVYRFELPREARPDRERMRGAWMCRVDRTGRVEPVQAVHDGVDIVAWDRVGS